MEINKKMNIVLQSRSWNYWSRRMSLDMYIL